MRNRRATREAVDQEFAAFVIGSQRSLRRTAYLMCGDWHRAEDIVQTALAKVYVHWSRVEHHEGPGPYARRAVVNATIDELRRPWRRERTVAEVPDRAAAADPFFGRSLDATLVEALAAMPPKQRAVVVLRYVDDLDVAQTAQLLGISQGTVKSQSARGLAALRVRLSETAVAVGRVPERVSGRLSA